MTKPEELVEIYRLIQKNRAYTITQDFGWLDGGCWMLASTVKRLLPTSKRIGVVPIGKGRDKIEHVAALYKGWVLDGSGVRTIESFRQYWENDPVDGLGRIRIVPFTKERAATDLSPFPTRADKLYQYLSDNLTTLASKHSSLPRKHTPNKRRVKPHKANLSLGTTR